MRIIKHPVLCNYYVTYRCNAACSFCDIWEKPSPYVTLDDVRTNLRALKRMGVRVVDFTGGEPLLHRELPHFLAEAKALGFLTTLTTNTLLYPKHALALRGKVDMLHFSLDSVDAERHNASRKVACFTHLQESIQIAKELGERPDILFTVTDDNVGELEEAYRTYVEGAGLILILNPMFVYNSVGEELAKSTLDRLRKWRNKPGVYLNEAFLALRKAGGNHIDRPVCKAGSSTIVISPENKLVLPCYHLGLAEVPIEGDLEAVWQSSDVQTLVALEGRHSGCEGCVVNCYMEPSMAVEFNPYWVRSIGSTVRYALQKWVYRG
jgi:MoaA/NifB/PqqE/SkfB family radical SAM enzyme